MDHHRERIEGQGYFNEANPLGGTGLEFLGVDGPRSIADRHPTTAEIPETRGAARFLEADADALAGRRLTEGADAGLHDRIHGAGAADADWPGGCLLLGETCLLRPTARL